MKYVLTIEANYDEEKYRGFYSFSGKYDFNALAE